MTTRADLTAIRRGERSQCVKDLQQLAERTEQGEGLKVAGVRPENVASALRGAARELDRLFRI